MVIISSIVIRWTPQMIFEIFYIMFATVWFQLLFHHLEVRKWVKMAIGQRGNTSSSHFTFCASSRMRCQVPCCSISHEMKSVKKYKVSFNIHVFVQHLFLCGYSSILYFFTKFPRHSFSFTTYKDVSKLSLFFGLKCSS